MFVLAREGRGGLESLPGTPIALVRSKNPNLHGLFLCAMTKEQVRTDKGVGANKPTKDTKKDEKDKDKDDEHEGGGRKHDPAEGGHVPYKDAPKRVSWAPSVGHSNAPQKHRGGSLADAGVSAWTPNPAALLADDRPMTMRMYAAAVEAAVGGALRGGAMPKHPEPPRGQKRRRADMSVDDALNEVPLALLESAEYDRAHAEMNPTRRRTSLKGGSTGTGSESVSEPGSGAGSGSGSGPLATSRAESGADRFSKLVYSVRLPEGTEFELLPRLGEDDRLTAFVAGKSGSGKSYSTAGVARMYHKNFPDRPIYLVCATKVSEDPAYDGLDVKQIDVSKFLGTAKSDGGFDVKAKFGDKGCLVIFDDIDAFPAATYNDLNTAITAIYNIGRKLKVSIIVTSHMLSNYNKTRNAIHESQFTVLYPQHDLEQAVSYVCDKMGVPKEISKNFRKKGRWVAIHTHDPHCIISATEAEMF